jgi:hypothetical protein
MIKDTARKIRKESELPNAELLMATGKMVNSYRKLLELNRNGRGAGANNEDCNYPLEGDPNYHSNFERGGPEILGVRRRLIR